MAAMPEETRKKISDGMKRAWESPTMRQRVSEGIKRAMTPAVRQKISRAGRERWRRWREAREAARTGND